MIRLEVRVVLLASLLALSAGCNTVSKKSPAMRAVKADFSVDAETMRIRTRALGGPFTGLIEESGNEILRGTDDIVVKTHALTWKADGLPAIRAALFRPDPLTALLDTWALTEQLIDYFESGPGRRRLGDWADVTLDAAREMRDEVVDVLSRMTTEEAIADGNLFINEWAKTHPIEDTIAARQSIMREVGAFKEQSGTGGLKVVGSLAITMDDMLRQIEAYTANIPKQARWEAELAILELAGAENFERTVELIPVLLDTTEQLASQIDDLPALVSHEREAVLKALRRERIESLAFLRQERLETLNQVSVEREAVLEHTEQLRIAITDALHAEVALVNDMIREQRALTMLDAEEIAGRTVDGTFERAMGLVDHIFLRVIVALALIFVGCVLLVLLAWRLFRTRPVTA
jgi:hypothetical protein